jgi:hypothetical protein
MSCNACEGVLNLTIAMITKIALSLFYIASLLLSPRLQEDSVRITQPGTGDSVQGIVEITGSVSTSAFASAELFYAYAAADNLNWFLISRIDQPVHSGVIARWDTTTITDGVYQLKLRVHYKDESFEDLIVNPVIVRNYTILSTNTPSAELITTASPLTQTAPDVELLFATPLPDNPASTSNASLQRSVITGLVAGVISLLIILAISAARNRMH